MWQPFVFGATLENTSTGVLDTHTAHDAPVSYFYKDMYVSERVKNEEQCVLLTASGKLCLQSLIYLPNLSLRY